MRNLLRRSAIDVLGGRVDARCLLCFDFDGTLAPREHDRRAAHARPETLAVLGRLAMRYRVAVISGRSRADLASRLMALPTLELVAEHGIERNQPSSAFRAAVARWAPLLAAARASYRQRRSRGVDTGRARGRAPSSMPNALAFRRASNRAR